MNSLLAIDDSVLIRDLITLTFNKEGERYEMTVTESGTEALSLIEQRRSSGLPPFALILVDVNMPLDISGYDTVKAIREMSDYLKIPILFLTADDTDEAKQQGKEVKATGWITKPFVPAVLLETIERILP